MNIKKILIDGLGLNRFGERYVNVAMILLAVSAGGVWWLFEDTHQRFMAAYIMFCVVAIATLYTLSPDITWQYNMRNPPAIDASGLRILSTHSPFFKALAIVEKKRFAARVAMFLNDKEFISEGTPEEDAELPYDIRVGIAACIIQFTFGLDEFWLPDLEKIISYPKLFPTVERNEFHAVETHDDGCIIISALMMREGLTKPNEFYHVGLHAAAEYWLLRKPEISLDGVWQTDAQNIAEYVENIRQIRQFRANYWQPLTGTPEVDLFCLASEAFFTKPNEMSEKMPATFDFISKTLNLDTRKDTYPLVQNVANW